MEPRSNYAGAMARAMPSATTDYPDKAVTDSAESLTRTAGHVAMNLAKSLEMIEEIETAVFGPTPADPQGGVGAPAVAYLRGILDENASVSASLAVRLENIAARIGRRDSR